MGPAHPSFQCLARPGSRSSTKNPSRTLWGVSVGSLCYAPDMWKEGAYSQKASYWLPGSAEVEAK